VNTPPSEATSQYPWPSGVAAMPTRGVCWLASALTLSDAPPNGTTESGDAARSPMCGTRTDVGTDALDRLRVGVQEMAIIATTSRVRMGGPPDRHALDFLTEVTIRHSIHAGHGEFVRMYDECRASIFLIYTHRARSTEPECLRSGQPSVD
jgi:hypothetical protein